MRAEIRASKDATAQRLLASAISLLLLSCLISGCIEDSGSQEGERKPLVIAYEVSPEMLESATNPQILADYISRNTNFDVSIYTVDSEVAMLEALRFGNVDIAYMDSGNAWVGWNQYGLEVLAADQKSDGRSYYNSHAWVLNDSDMAIAHLDSDPLTNPFSLMQGKTSCHTGWLKSVGMMLPMGFLLGLGYANVIGDPNDVESLRNTIYGFFNENSSIPEPGTPHYGLQGALKCLSDGTGEIAFAKDNSIADLCPQWGAEERKDWCLDNGRYVLLDSFAKSPSDAFIYNPEHLDKEEVNDVTNLLTSLGDEHESVEILFNTFGTSGVTETNSNDHLGIYSSLVSSIPGISSYYVDNQSDGGEITISLEEVRLAFRANQSVNGTNQDPHILADYLTMKLGVNVTIFYVDSEFEKITSLESGDAHIALMDHSYSVIGWKKHSLAVLAAMQNEDQNTSSEISGWALSESELASYSQDQDSSTNPFSISEGMISCHSGTDPYSSLIAPLSYIIGNGHMPLSEDLDNQSLDSLIQSYFNELSSIPLPDSDYYGESGAIRCISDESGQIAFVGQNFIHTECSDPSEGEESWCLGESSYTSLGSIGQIPTTSVIYNPSILDTRSRTSILNALIDMNYEMYLENYSRPGMGTYTGCYDISIHKVSTETPKEVCGDEILKNVLSGPGVVRATSQDHLGRLSDNLLLVPGAFPALERYVIDSNA